MPTPSKSTRSKLEISRLEQAAIQRELMGKDLDLKTLLVYFKSVIKFDAVERVTDARVKRTIEGASTLTITLNDADRSILTSGILANRLDIQIDGLWFRLAAVTKPLGSDNLMLTFEDREIAILRTYREKKIRKRPVKMASRARATRAEFVLNLIREVKEFKIPVTIPELHKVQPIEVAAEVPGQFEVAEGRTTGIAYETAVPDSSAGVERAEGTGTRTPADDPNKFVPGVTDFPTPSNRIQAARGALTVKGKQATKTQVDNANIILSVGSSMGARRKVLVCAIMTAITESLLYNLDHGDGTSVGLFQQTDNGAWGTLRDRMDPATSARMFFLKAIKADANDPTRPYWDLCDQVQRSAHPLATAEWRTEGERFVTAFGIVGSDTEGSATLANNSWSPDQDAGDYFFYRGKPENGGKSWEPEDSWACIQRLADEVNWRAFFVSGRFYFMSEDELFKSKPLGVFQEFQEGVEGIGGEYDSGKEVASVTMSMRVGRWSVPPGSVIVLRNMGVWNGRWLVTDYERGLFDSIATVTLKKPRPKLPEPIDNAIEQEGVGGFTNPGQEYERGPVTVGQAGSPLPYQVTKAMVISTPAQHRGRNDSVGDNWQSNDAYDIKADAGTAVYTPVSGTVTKVNLRNQGVHEGVIFGAQVTVLGDDGIYWWFTHIEDVPSKLVSGYKLFKGEQIGRVTLWSTHPEGTHLHIAADSLLALETIFAPGERVN